MTEPLRPLLDRLRALRDETWDPEVGLARMAPGVAPEVDIAALGLHAVRESALGALADLDDGRVDRATRALDRVLALQLHAPGRPWDGTFPVTAEQPPPPEAGAVEWLHYDPNWRQFLGTALGLVVERHAAALDAGLLDRLVGAVVRCARGEPVDRIPPWYTNPDLLHAWVQAWAGTRSGDASLVAAGTDRARAAAARVAAVGDVDEYGSPTYDGVDLLALGLWVAHPPAPAFVDVGTSILGAVGPRIAALFHAELGAVCGPHIRAYGLGLDRYVALVAPWLVAAGAAPDAVLPWPLATTTDHVHDLWFTPVVAALAPAVVPHLVLRTDLPRRHVQHLGAVTATSVLTDRAALGAERGRRPEFARDQHVPVTAHAAEGWVGLALGDGAAGIDADVPDDATIRAAVVPAPGAVEVVVRSTWSAPPTLDATGARLGALTLRATPAAAERTAGRDHRGAWLELRWPVADAPTVTVTVGADPAVAPLP